jgi:type IV pilus assembly protein PilE
MADMKSGMVTHKTGRGFTLLELMVTVAVVAILAAIAYPAYQDQVRKSRRAEIQGVLVEMANLQQQFFSDNFTYATTAQLGYPAAYPLPPATAFYSLDVSVSSAAGFTVRAQTAGPQVSDTRCKEMTLVNTGVKASKDSSAADSTAFCWRS